MSDTRFFDTFTGEEAALMQGIMDELKGVTWAKPALDEIARHGGLTAANMTRFFELRQGHALHKAGVALRYEVPGEGDSTLDYGFTSAGTAWNVECMRLDETDAAKDATTTRVDENGSQWAGRFLHSNAEDSRQTTEGELIKAVQRICQKCERAGKPHKFLPSGNGVNVIIVDVRTLNHGRNDRYDIEQLVHGGERVPPQFRLSFGDPPKAITGVFSADTNQKGALTLRERLHFLGIVQERTFAPGEFGRVTQFHANPHLFADQAAAEAEYKTWPLQPT